MSTDAVLTAVVRAVARRPWLGSFALLLTSVVVSLYASEALIAVVQPRAYDPLRPVDSRPTNVKDASFDRRSSVEVVLDLRANGIVAYPFPRRTQLARSYHDASGERTHAAFALAGASRTFTVFCNERGRYPFFASDRFGFNNPESAWQHTHVDLALVGDSFTHGACLDTAQSVTNVLRDAFPASLSFGMSGDGPLTELATLREYVAPLRPRAVLWLYYPGNDFSDFEEERAEPALMRYLVPGHSQSLLRRQPEIDAAQRQWLDRQITEVLLRHNDRRDKFRGFATLRLLRTQLWGPIRARITRSCSADRITRFTEVLASAGRQVKEWGGRLYFVELATWNGTAKDDRCAPDASEIGRVVEALHLPLIDVAAVFSRERTADSLWVARALGYHYSAAGYAVLAHAIVERLRRDGIEPSTP